MNRSCVVTPPVFIAGALVAVASLVAPAVVAAQQTCVATASFTSGQQAFVVPGGVTTIAIDVFGAQGGSLPSAQNPGVGGLGGRATAATVAVTAGESLTVVVGAQGASIPGPLNATPSPGGAGGFPNGGPGGASVSGGGGLTAAHPGAGGGGASWVARGVTRLIVAGGGGGGSHGGGGGAGGQNGAAGAKTSPDGTSTPGQGGTAAGVGGAGGVGSGATGGPGTVGGGTATGQGGTGGVGGDAGGGAGGGWAGGGGGGGGVASAPGGASGGGGGSSVGPAGTTFQTGVRTGNGLIEIRYPDPACQPGISIVKSGSGPTPLVLGSTVTYSFLVTNTGNVPLTAVTVTDPLPGLSAITCPGTALTPAQSMTCTATYVITTPNVTAGVVNNTATTTGQPPPGAVAPIAQGSASVIVPAPVPTLPPGMLFLLAALLTATAVWRLRRGQAAAD